MITQEAMMREALSEAMEALSEGEIPVGAVIEYDGKIISRAHNLCEQIKDPTAHAELLAIKAAAKALGTRSLKGCTIYVTLEPCPMCAGAMVMSRLERCYFATPDVRQGCAESVYALTREPSFYHRLSCVGGLLQNEAQELLNRFFGELRRKGD